MSQYAIVPINNTAALREAYNVANPSTWTFTKNEVHYGGCEEAEFSQQQLEDIKAAGGTVFLNAEEYMRWFAQ